MNDISKQYSSRKIVLNPLAQIAINMDFINESIKLKIEIKKIYEILYQDKKFSFSYPCFNTNLKKLLNDTNKNQNSTTIIKKAKPEEPEGFHPIDNPEDFRDELI